MTRLVIPQFFDTKIEIDTIVINEGVDLVATNSLQQFVNINTHYQEAEYLMWYFYEHVYCSPIKIKKQYFHNDFFE